MSVAPDFSVIGETPDASKSSPIQAAEFAGLEITALQQGKTEFQQEQLKHSMNLWRIEIDRLNADIVNIHQDIGLRSKFSGQILCDLWIFSGFCGVVILMNGFPGIGFHLETAVLTTLVGGTAASAFGLVSVVLGGLFKNGGHQNHKASAKKAKPSKGSGDVRA